MLLGKNETIAQPARASHKPNRGIGYPGYLPTGHFIYTHECMVKTQKTRPKTRPTRQAFWFTVQKNRRLSPATASFPGTSRTRQTCSTPRWTGLPCRGNRPFKKSMKTSTQTSKKTPGARRCTSCARSSGKHCAMQRQTPARASEAATQKVECADKLQAVRWCKSTLRPEFSAQFTLGLRLTAASQRMTLAISPTVAANGLYAMVDGLVQN